LISPLAVDLPERKPRLVQDPIPSDLLRELPKGCLKRENGK
jgi:hypothetical protein